MRELLKKTDCSIIEVGLRLLLQNEPLLLLTFAIFMWTKAS